MTLSQIYHSVNQHTLCERACTVNISALHSHECTAPGDRLGPHKCCHQCHRVERVPLPDEAGSAPCDDTAPGREASQSDQAPWRKTQHS